MAEVESSLLAFLLLDTAIADAFVDRIYVDYVPDEQTYPYAKISTVDTASTYTQDGEGHKTVLLQIDVYHSDKANCNTSAGTIKAALSGYRGVMGDITAGRVFIRDVRGTWNPDVRNFRRILEVEIGTND